VVDSMMVVGPEWFRKQLESASPDLLREMVGSFIAALMGAEADAVCGAPYGESSAERVNSRNGYRPKTVVTGNCGEVEIAVPRDRDGSFEPQIVAKRQRRLTDLDQLVISLYAKGLTTGEISAHFAQMYGASVSEETISRIIDNVIEVDDAGRVRAVARPRDARLASGDRHGRPARTVRRRT